MQPRAHTSTCASCDGERGGGGGAAVLGVAWRCTFSLMTWRLYKSHISGARYWAVVVREIMSWRHVVRRNKQNGSASKQKAAECTSSREISLLFS
jgi:hypothetical protein